MKYLSCTKRFAAIFAVASVLCSSVTHAVDLSSLTTIPTDGSVNINIASTGVGLGITARYFAEDNQRSVAQTFTWNSNGDMSGLGLLIAPDQNSGGGKFFTQDQDYFLDIQQLQSATDNRSVQDTLTTASFTLTTSVIVAGQYLYIEFDTPLDLENGSSYGFNLRPGELIAGNAISVDQSAIAYANGVGQQRGTVAIIPDGSAYGNAGLDFAFYTTSTVPESSSSALWLGIMAGIGVFFVSRRRHNKHRS